jgi:Transposase
MFINRSKNKSGTISIRVLEKRGRNNVLVKSFGSSAEEDEIKQMIERAKVFIKHQTGTYYNLFNPPPEQDLSEFVDSLSNNQISVVGPELIFGRLFDHVGYGKIGGLFRPLVLSRLVSPGSKLKTVDYLWRYNGISYDINKVYRYLDKLCERGGNTGIKDIVEQITFAHSATSMGGCIDVVFYDVSTLFFEAADEDDLRRTGYSKDGKFDCPQILLGLLVTREGLPISYEIFEGNLSEKKTFIPLLKRAQEKFGFGTPIVIADSGLLSRKNIETLVSDGYEYILGAKMKNENNDVKRRILQLQLSDGEVKSITTDDGLRIVVSMAENRRKRDAFNRAKGLKRLQEKVASGKIKKQHINNRGYNKYLRISGEATISIDTDAFEQDSVWDGLKGYVTNTSLSDKDVIENYHNLWFIERAFRMNKTDLKIRPMYHRLRNRIEGHICICFCAYMLQLEIERMLKEAGSDITIDKAREIVKTMYAITYTKPGHMKSSKVMLKMDNDQKELFNIVENWVKPNLGNA